MIVHNSYVEYVLGTQSALLKDFADQYPDSTKEFERDLERLSSAVEHHGILFFLDVMPAFRKHFDKCLSNGCLTPSGLIHFGSAKRGETVPRLFRGLTLRIFDRIGTLRFDADPNAIRCLRQILGSVRKLRVDCGLQNRRKAVKEFFDIENEIPKPSEFWAQSSEEEIEPDDNLSFETATRTVALPLFESHAHGEVFDRPGLLRTLQQVADLVCSSLGEFDPFAHRAKHGPGAVTDFKFGDDKYRFRSWSRRLDKVFPYSDFGVANFSLWVDNVLQNEVPGDSDLPAKLAAVPKTITKPRLIAVESVASQWCQQILLDFFCTRIENTLLRSFISFRKQEYNGELALRASHEQSHATIDLSNASDRISCWHIERLFRRSRGLLHALRSTRTAWLRQDICGHLPRYTYLRKYSTMGNGTTFPVQSLFFLAAAIACELYVHKRRVSFKEVRALAGKQIRVFGDDIITPNTSSGVLVELLHHLGLKVNDSKTFEQGKFKESCGVDAFDGHNVTTVSIMDVPQRAKPGTIVSTVDVHNNLLVAGYFRTAAYVRKMAEPHCRKIREVAHGSGSFGWYPNPLIPAVPATLRSKYCKDRQIQLVHAALVTTKQPRHAALGNSGVLQYHTEAPKRVTSAVSTLGYPLRRAQVRLGLGWVPLHA
jgi:hypothetical protein